MADTKISALTAATAVAAGDVVPVVQGGVTKKADVTLLKGVVATGDLICEPSSGDAAAGDIGEYVFVNLPAGSPTSLTSGTAKNIISTTLTPGDWDVCGQIGFIPAGTTNITRYIAAISTTANSIPGSDTGQVAIRTQSGSVDGTAGSIMPTPVCRMALSANTTISLVAQAVFTVSTMTAFGSMRCRRVR